MNCVPLFDSFKDLLSSSQSSDGINTCKNLVRFLTQLTFSIIALSSCLTACLCRRTVVYFGGAGSSGYISYFPGYKPKTLAQEMLTKIQAAASTAVRCHVPQTGVPKTLIVCPIEDRAIDPISPEYPVMSRDRASRVRTLAQMVRDSASEI